MSKTLHRIYIFTMVAITVGVTTYLSYVGWEYYNTPLEERFYLDQHEDYKPSGLVGHGLGFIGTFLILFGVVIYIVFKRNKTLARKVRLKYLLEFHIFLCTLGPIMILFHTAFKFGGIVSVAFWSMVAVVLSGVIGRFIYIQIPRTIEGQALTMDELRKMKNDLTETIRKKADDEALDDVLETMKDPALMSKRTVRRSLVRSAISILKQKGIERSERSFIIKMIKEELGLAVKISRLKKMQQLFKYWHVAHLPFALIMLIIVVLHVGVSLAFGYTWIF
ncbi:MAG: hypothetical protein JXR03_04310 [Cyclobacteriaceae bacterium]